jgi:allophanate hydrolase subunit 2
MIAGDRLPLNRDTASERDEYQFERFDLSVRTCLRAVDGPQIDRFSPDEIAAFFGSEYVVTAADRMGMRLRGRKLNHRQGHDVISEGIAPGSIQISGAGDPIVLLADRQTTGGYPKIATVISADLPALGRLPIGAMISFERVSMAEASRLRRKLLAQIEAISGRMVRIDAPAQRCPDLLQVNLISGVIDARI